MPERLLIVGTSGYAKEIGYIARRIDPDCRLWDKISYVSNSPSEKGRSLLFGQVDFCDADVLSSGMTVDVVIGVGDPDLRSRVAARYLEFSALSFPNVIDPSANLDPRLIRLGKGNVIEPGVLMSYGIAVGDFNLFNKACVVSHDVRIGSFNAIHPSATLLSNSRLGNYCVLGCGARVLPNISVADRTILGAGAVVLRDIAEPGHTFIGVPAKQIR
jgi:sugar O-acyltransferase (sialic acid O-acetyltransferase NeuD family)